MSETNNKRVFSPLGASSHSEKDRESNDYYATDPIALELLLEKEGFSNKVWECACGEGHLSKVLEAHGYDVISTDLIDRGFGTGGIDFFECGMPDSFDGDIITNPPYKYAEKFVRHAIDVIADGHRVAMFLKVLFLESKSRRQLFDVYPPKYIYVASGRFDCAVNGAFKDTQRSAQAYAWFIWEKPFYGEPVVRWFN